MLKMTVLVVDVMDGRSFRVSTGGTCYLKDAKVPSLLDPIGRRARTRLEELILHQHVDCDDLDSDELNNIYARVTVEGVDVNLEIRKIVEGPNAVAPRPSASEQPAPVKKVEIDVDPAAFGRDSPGEQPRTTGKVRQKADDK